MADKLNLSIDLLKLQGAKIEQNQDGSLAVVIYLNESRAKHYPGKGEYGPSAFLKMDAVASEKLRNENTHFIVEAVTKEERQAKVKMPIIGDAREFNFDKPSQQSNRPAERRQGRTQQPSQVNPEDKLDW